MKKNLPPQAFSGLAHSQRTIRRLAKPHADTEFKFEGVMLESLPAKDLLKLCRVLLSRESSLNIQTRIMPLPATNPIKEYVLESERRLWERTHDSEGVILPSVAFEKARAGVPWPARINPADFVMNDQYNYDLAACHRAIDDGVQYPETD